MSIITIDKRSVIKTLRNGRTNTTTGGASGSGSASSGIAYAPITGGSGYIQNQQETDQVANFKIKGFGRISNPAIEKAFVEDLILSSTGSQADSSHGISFRDYDGDNEAHWNSGQIATVREETANDFGVAIKTSIGAILQDSVYISSDGKVVIKNQFKTSIATGTPPLVVLSTTKVENLNASLLDGKLSTDFALSGHTHSGVYEPVLGNPSANGMILASSTTGVRSWVALPTPQSWSFGVNTDDAIVIGDPNFETYQGIRLVAGSGVSFAESNSGTVGSYLRQLTINASSGTVLNGTGFVKASGASISYDNTTYSPASHTHTGVYEPVLGNPSTNGMILASSTTGVRSWVALPTPQSWYFGVNTDDAIVIGDPLFETYQGIRLVAGSGMSFGLASVGTAGATLAQLTLNASGAYEPIINNPSANGMILTSSTAGVRSWKEDIETFVMQFDLSSNGSTMFIMPKAYHNYQIVSCWVQSKNGSSSSHFSKNGSASTSFNHNTTGGEIAGGATYLPGTLSIGDSLSFTVDVASGIAVTVLKLKRV